MFQVLKTAGWSPKTILDIGGYKGNWTRDVRKQFPLARFTVIEPNPHPELLSLGVPVYKELLSSEIKDVLWHSNMTTGDSMYKEKTRHYNGVVPITCQTTTLDTLFPSQTFEFIKIDCQGAELDILKGGKNVLQHTEVVLLECSFAGQYNQGAPSFAEYITYMDTIGFAPLDIPELHRANGILVQIDIVFLRKTNPIWERIQSTLIL
jgi:FkbM family methyltransferase